MKFEFIVKPMPTFFVKLGEQEVKADAVYAILAYLETYSSLETSDIEFDTSVAKAMTDVGMLQKIDHKYYVEYCRIEKHTELFTAFIEAYFAKEEAAEAAGEGAKPVSEITIKIHEIAKDGLPDMKTNEELTGRVAFIFDGCIVSGWPLQDDLWEANSDVGNGIPFSGVTHWVEFPVPVWDLE